MRPLASLPATQNINVSGCKSRLLELERQRGSKKSYKRIEDPGRYYLLCVLLLVCGNCP